MSFFTTQGAPAPGSDEDLQQSPLWPLQKAMRDLYNAAKNSGVTGDQLSGAEPSKLDAEGMFTSWRSFNSRTLLRATIRSLLSPPKCDFSGDTMLADFQQQLLALPQWNDILPD